MLVGLPSVQHLRVCYDFLANLTHFKINARNTLKEKEYNCRHLTELFPNLEGLIYIDETRIPHML